MNAKLETAAGTGLQFFGKMFASITHEIKNVLAIINENAGLLDDIASMAERGVPVDPARLKKLAVTVTNNIVRGDTIAKKMNRLAHSVDEPIAIAELSETIGLFIVLTDRFAAMRGVTIKPALPGHPVNIRTSSFFLINLLWLCLEYALDAGSAVKQIELCAEQTENGCEIRFKQLAGLMDPPAGNFPSDREKSLLTLLEADLTVNPANEEIVLKIHPLP